MEIEFKAQKAILRTEEDKNNLSEKIKLKSEGILEGLINAFEEQAKSLKEEGESVLNKEFALLNQTLENSQDQMAEEYDKNKSIWAEDIVKKVIGQ